MPTSRITPPSDDLTPTEVATVDLVSALLDSGDVGPLVDVLVDGHVGHGRAQDALRVLAEWDAEVLVQVALKALNHQAERVRTFDGLPPGAPRISGLVQ